MPDTARQGRDNEHQARRQLEEGCWCRIGNGDDCGAPAESHWEGGCVHEHVMTGIPVCAEHRYIVEKPLRCLVCGHDCEVILREAVRG